MSSLSYKILRGTCLRFSEQLQVVVTSDVLQEWLPAHSVALAMVLESRVQAWGEERFLERIFFSLFFHNLRRRLKKALKSPWISPYDVLFLLLFVEGGVPLLPELCHLLLVAQLALRRCLRPQRQILHKHFWQLNKRNANRKAIYHKVKMPKIVIDLYKEPH